jgi:DNA-binding transcriptional MerR regulator
VFIKEVCEKCSLTKKAVEYYEKQGLLQPKIGENGYRNYTEKDVAVLKEISLLRRLGLSISEIKDVLESSNKPLTLSKYKYLMELKGQKAAAQQKCLDYLMNHYDIDKASEYFDTHLNPLFTIRERLVQSFPGSYGMYLSIHFGQFLNETIDSPEKKEAFAQIVHYLDHLKITEETEECLENFLPLAEKEDMEYISRTFIHALDDLDNFIASNKKSIEDYIQLRASKEYQSSPAYKIQQFLVKLQQSSGYKEILITNLKILSRSYREFSEKLQEANQWFMEKYPQTEKFV